MLTALCVACAFVPAWAGTFVAAKRPVFHTDLRQSLGDEGALRMATAEIRQHVSTAGLRFREAALHSAPLRDPFFPRLLNDARSALPILALACVLRSKRCARTPYPSSMPHYHAAGGGRHPCSRCPQASLRSATGTAPEGPPFGQPPWLATLAPPAVKDSFNTILL